MARARGRQLLWQIAKSRRYAFRFPSLSALKFGAAPCLPDSGRHSNPSPAWSHCSGHPCQSRLICRSPPIRRHGTGFRDPSPSHTSHSLYTSLPSHRHRCGHVGPGACLPPHGQPERRRLPVPVGRPGHESTRQTGRGRIAWPGGGGARRHPTRTRTRSQLESVRVLARRQEGSMWCQSRWPTRMPGDPPPALRRVTGWTGWHWQVTPGPAAHCAATKA